MVCPLEMVELIRTGDVVVVPTMTWPLEAVELISIGKGVEMPNIISPFAAVELISTGDGVVSWRIICPLEAVELVRIGNGLEVPTTTWPLEIAELTRTGNGVETTGCPVTEETARERPAKPSILLSLGVSGTKPVGVDSEIVGMVSVVEVPFTTVATGVANVETSVNSATGKLEDAVALLKLNAVVGTLKVDKIEVAFPMIVVDFCCPRVLLANDSGIELKPYPGGTPEDGPNGKDSRVT